MLTVILLPISAFAQYNDGETFSVYVDGVEMTVKVISATEKTAQVGNDINPAINTNIQGTIDIPRTVNGYTITEIGSKAFQNCAISKVIFSNAVTCIKNDAFRNCEKLGRIDIPNSVNAIGSYAFNGCSNLDDVRSFIEVPFDIENNVFQNVQSYASLTVLYGTKQKYLSSKGWSAFSEIWSDMAYIGGIRYSVNGAVPEDKGEPYTAWVESSPKWTFYGGDVEIPESFNIGEETFAVKGIDDGAFEGSSITSVIIPKTIKSIDDGAFMNCSQLLRVLSRIKEPFSVRSTVFQNIPTNAVLYVPIGSKSLYENTEGWNAFSNIIESEEMGEETFVDGNVFTTENIEGVEMTFKVISAAKKTVQVGTGNESAISTQIDGIVSIPSEVKGYSVVAISDFAFYDCSSLTSITIPNSVTTIGDYAFSYCSGLTSVTIPNSVTTIGKSAFRECTGLTSVTISENVTSIGWSVFNGCISLSTLVIPKSVISIGFFSFDNCPGLASIVVEEGNPIYDSRENCNAIIETASNKLILGCKNTVIPTTVEILDYNSFEWCKSMTSIIIPSNVKAINGGVNEGAFFRCDSLLYIRSLIKEPFEISRDVFSQNTYDNGTLIVPMGCKEKYLATNNWNSFKNIVEYGDGYVFTAPLADGVDMTFQIISVEEGTCRVGDNSNVAIEPSYKGVITIPSVVKVPIINEDLTVVEIGSNAFSGCANLTSIAIPDGVTVVGSGAFRIVFRDLQTTMNNEKQSNLNY